MFYFLTMSNFNLFLLLTLSVYGSSDINLYIYIHKHNYTYSYLLNKIVYTVLSPFYCYLRVMYSVFFIFKYHCMH